MLNILNIPIQIRCLFVIVLGLLTARAINWAIYNWAYFPRDLGPWSKPTPATSKSSRKNKRKSANTSPTRSWQDHLPILGWWRLRRESQLHGNGYWIRPLLIELAFPIALAWYYKFQITGAGFPPGAAKFLMPLELQLHAQFAGHWVLLSLMTIGTFIDFDEQTIPDYVTIPGTIIGVVGSAFAPLWLPITYSMVGIGWVEMDSHWPASLPGWHTTWVGLMVGLLILAVWGFGLLDRRVILRRGWKKAVAYFFARMFRFKPLWLTVVLTTVGLMLLTTVCWWNGVTRWNFLLSSLLGLAFAGGVTWAVRISATYGYGIEALGFGDVTLMAMIGAYIGWQPSLAVFFLAPFVAIVFVLVRWMITRDTSTPYGPYLCGAALTLLVFWNDLWIMRFSTVFVMADDLAVQVVGPGLGWNFSGADLILVSMFVCVVLIGVMLWMWQLVKSVIFGERVAGHE